MLYDRLSKNLLYMNAKAIASNNKFTQLAKYPEVCIEHAFINYMVCASTVPLLKEALSCAQLLPEGELRNILTSYLRRHIAEETDHDEWYLDDLEVLGFTREEVKLKIPPANLATMIGSQYYWIRHYHPVSIMGYLACLEVHHPTVDYVDSLIEMSGLPADGFNCLRHHAEVDLTHKQDIIDVINSLPLAENQYQIMELSAFQTYRYVSLVMEDVCKAAPRESLAVV